MRLLEILVEAVALRDELLLPLSESLLLDLNLLGEALAESFFLLLILGVIQLAGTGLPELPGLHLLSAVRLIVKLLGGVDQVEHVRTDENRSQLLEVAVVLVLDLSNTPRVLTTLHDAAVASLDVLLRADNRKWHSGHETARMLGGGLIVLLNWRLVDLNTLRLDNSPDLHDTLVKDSIEAFKVEVYLSLEFGEINRAQSISLGNNRDQVDS